MLRPLALTQVSAVCLTVFLAASTQASTQASDPDTATAGAEGSLDDLPNLFEGVESWTYPNGLLVYFKNIPGAQEVFLRATLPVGARQDPPDRAGLAHFVEHLMFTGPDGMSQAEFKRLVEDRGGSTNASTNWDRTDYWLRVPPAEWRFGLDWFGDLLLGHELVEEHAEQERKAVILEGDLEKRTPYDYLVEHVLSPEWSEGIDFWERELGIPTERLNTLGTWEEIQATTRDDLQAFYERWYGPQNMTLAIFGPLDRDAVKAIVDGSFGAAPRFGESPPVRVDGEPRNRPRHGFSFEQRGGHRHRLTYLLPDFTREDWAWLGFLRSLLSERLNDVLREERQAAYSVRVRRDAHRGHATLEVEGNFEPEQEASARAFVESLIADLRADRMDPVLFRSLQRRVVAALLLANQKPSDLASAIESYLYQREIHGDEFPDVVAFRRDASSADLAAWMNERVRDDRLVTSVDRPSPTWPLVEFAFFVVVPVLAFGAARRLLIRPLDLTRLVYLRRFHYGLVPSLLGVALFFIGFVVGINCLGLVLRHVERAIVQPVDSYLVNAAYLIAVLVGVTLAVVLVPASIPRKILMLEDHWRVKALSYRSRSFRYEDITGLSRRHLLAVLFDRRAWPCRILHWGIFRRGVHLRAGRGSWFFHTRNDAELIEQLIGRGAAGSQGSASQSGESHRTLGAASGGTLRNLANARADLQRQRNRR